MTGSGSRSGPFKPHVRQISEIANGMLDPVLARRAGIDTMLIAAWEDIAGPEFAECTRPERIKWGRPASSASAVDGEAFSPGTLTVACEGARAVFLMHAEGELIQRVNAFFGFRAVERLRIVQKPVAPPPRRRPPVAPLDREKRTHLDGLVGDIDDEKLRAALVRLGEAVLGRKPRR